MGYHDAVGQHRKIIADACRFINDRERTAFALRIALQILGVSALEQQQILTDAKACNFDTLTAMRARRLPAESDRKEA